MPLSTNQARAAGTLLCVLVSSGCNIPKDARAAAGAVAHEACARMFISNLSADEALEHPSELINRLLPSASAYPTITVGAAGTVTASIGGSVSATAVYRGELGCTLLFDKTATEVRAQPERAPELGSLSAGAWPRGDDGPVTLPGTLQDAWDEDVLRDLYGAESADGNTLKTLAVAIAQHGQLVYERYESEIDPASSVRADTRLCGYSMTKSLLALGLGSLWDRGQFDLNAPMPVDEWVANPNETRRDTWRNFLHMETNITYSEGGTGLQYARVFELLFRNGDTARYMGIRAPKPYYQLRHTYSTGNSILLSRELQQLLEAESTGSASGYQLALDHFADNLFKPTGITSAVIEADEAGTIQGGSYAFMTTRDWLRLGQLFLKNGRVDDEAVVSEAWISFMKARSPNSAGYGAHVWRYTVNVPVLEGAQPKSAEAYAFVGLGGQGVIVVPDYDLVYARLGATWDPATARDSNLLALGNILAELDAQQ